MTLSFLRQPAVALALAALGGALPAHAELAYRSAFDAVRPHADPQALEWRAANDRMAALGGHAGHLRAGAAGTPGASGGDRPPSQGADCGNTHAAAHGKGQDTSCSPAHAHPDRQEAVR